MGRTLREWEGLGILKTIPAHLYVKSTLRRARLVLGWVTVYGQVNHLGRKPAS